MVKNPPAKAEDTDSILGSGRSPGGGNGTPLHYSCLGNPMARGAWRATVSGVEESQTRLSTHSSRVFLAPCGLFSGCSDRGLLSSCGARASCCCGFSCGGAGSLEFGGFSGSPVTCAILPDQGSNPWPLHRPVDSSPPGPQGRPGTGMSDTLQGGSDGRLAWGALGLKALVGAQFIGRFLLRQAPVLSGVSLA